MKKIEAKIIADSINPQGDRITTYILTFPRFILAELNTHRVFSKNSASSRAIPFEKMVKMVKEDPFIPIAWQKDHKGMQGTEYFTIEDDKQLLTSGKYYSTLDKLEERWLTARDKAIQFATDLNTIGVTKQICNRLLEPFLWYTNLVTVTELENFYELRCPKYKIYSENIPMYFRSRKDLNKYVEAVGDTPFELTEENWWMQSESGAEIHIQALAEAMWDAQNESTPNQLKAGEWHMPFEDIMQDRDIMQHVKGSFNSRTEVEEAIQKFKIKIATARCARLSYMTFDGEIDYKKDLKLHDTLLKSHHMSPFEHCARAMSDEEYLTNIKGKINADEYHLDNEDGFPNYVNPTGISIENSVSGWCNNFRGFIQYRYLIENDYENNNKFY